MHLKKPLHSEEFQFSQNQPELFPGETSLALSQGEDAPETEALLPTQKELEEEGQLKLILPGEA